MKSWFILVSSIVLCMLSSCQPDELEDTPPSEIDRKLEQQLITASDGIGKSYYTLPESNDLTKIPQDPLNPLTAEKVALGKFLFHETGLGQNPVLKIGMNSYSCASCHHAKAGFQACVPQGIGEGGIGFGETGEARVVNPAYKMKQIDVQPIRTPSVLNIAYQTNVLWNGQFGATHLNQRTNDKWTEGTPKAKNKLGFQGVETQAIAGRDVHRLVIDNIFLSSVGNYKSLYTRAFDTESLKERSRVANNGALAIAAFERTVLANQAPFQLWLKGDNAAMGETEKQGALLFFGKAGCSGCHNGPSLAKMEFYALGMNNLHNGNYGNNIVINIAEGQPEDKGRGGFTGRAEDMYKFKVPQLYNLKDSPFYGHGASFNSVKAVVEYKNKAEIQNRQVPTNQLPQEFKPLNLTTLEVNQLTAFIEKALYDPALNRYVPAKLPSNLCFPNNDDRSRVDLGF